MTFIGIFVAFFCFFLYVFTVANLDYLLVTLKTRQKEKSGLYSLLEVMNKTSLMVTQNVSFVGTFIYHPVQILLTSGFGAYACTSLR